MPGRILTADEYKRVDRGGRGCPRDQSFKSFFLFFPSSPACGVLVVEYPTDTHGKYWQELMNTAKTKENRFFSFSDSFFFFSFFATHQKAYKLASGLDQSPTFS